MLLAAVLVLVLLFVPFPQRSTLKAMVTPMTEFQLLSNGSGEYTTLLKDNWDNLVKHTRTITPQRGEVMDYTSNLEIRPGRVSR